MSSTKINKLFGETQLAMWNLQQKALYILLLFVTCVLHILYMVNIYNKHIYVYIYITYYIYIFSHLESLTKGKGRPRYLGERAVACLLGKSLFLSRPQFPHLRNGPSRKALPAHLWRSAAPTHLLDHDAVHAHGLESPRVVEHVRPAQGHGQHEAGEVLFAGKQVQEDRQYHKQSLDKTVQETQETRALLTSWHQGRDVQILQPPLNPE